MKPSTLSAATRKRGISLIEAVLYLVIALAVIVGGIVFFQQAQLSNQVTDTARMSTGVSSQVRSLFQNQRSFGTADLTEAMIKSGAIPSNFISEVSVGPRSRTDVVHPFGGTVLFLGYDTYFVTQYNDMSKTGCLRLMTVGEGGNGSIGTGITGLSIENSTDTFAQAVPITAADLAGACGDNNEIKVQYSRGGGGEYDTP